MIYYHHPEPKRVLFHLGRDLGERQDLASQQKEVLESLSSDLATHLRETGAALPSIDGQTIPMPDELRP